MIIIVMIFFLVHHSPHHTQCIIIINNLLVPTASSMHHKQRDRATSSVRKIDHYDRRPDDTATDGFYDDEQDVNDDDYDYMVHD